EDKFTRPRGISSSFGTERTEPYFLAGIPVAERTEQAPVPAVRADRQLPVPHLGQRLAELTERFQIRVGVGHVLPGLLVEVQVSPRVTRPRHPVTPEVLQERGRTEGVAGVNAEIGVNAGDQGLFDAVPAPT